MCWNLPTDAARPTRVQRGVDGQRFEDIEAYGGGPLARGTGGQAEDEDLRTECGQAGLDIEAEQQQAASFRGAHDHRQSGPDGGASGA